MQMQVLKVCVCGSKDFFFFCEFSRICNKMNECDIQDQDVQNSVYKEYDESRSSKETPLTTQ